MSKRWYNYFVSVGDEGPVEQQPKPAAPATSQPTAPAKAAPRSAAQTVAEIAAAVNVEPKFTQPVANAASFDEIYRAAEITPPPNGFTIFKVADLLRSPHIKDLPVEVKRSSVMLALDAAGVKLQDILQDAVRRDRALDTFETVQQRALEQLESRKADENKKLQDEMDRVMNDFRARIQANQDQVARERERFLAWRRQKQQEEQRIADTVAPFVSENPITTGAVTAAKPAAAETKGS